MPMIQLQARISLLFASGPANLDVDFSLKAGSLTGLFGPSGSGKTTLLRILAGLTMPEQGTIRVSDRVWLDTERGINLPTQQRRVGMVFQDAALFPNMSVRENVAFAAENRRDPIVNELLDLVGLSNLADRKPATLSGGQRQRVALIRALARRPQVLLLDEPFSALDHETREQLLAELVRLHQRFGTTTVLVSHQQQEIHRVADQLVELKQGKAYIIEKIVDHKASFQSISGFVSGILVESAQIQVRLPETTVVLAAPSHVLKWQIGEAVTLAIDPVSLLQKPYQAEEP